MSTSYALRNFLLLNETKAKNASENLLHILKRRTKRLHNQAWLYAIHIFIISSSAFRVGVDEHTEVPVFVCTLAFPSLKYPLHIFEPRYRLMIRKSYELGTGMFGMCAYDPDFGFSEYGTMLSIDKMELLPDGRSIIQTTATRRFRVMSRGMTDGYNTATVQWLEDDAPPELAHGEVADLDILSTDCRKHLRIWFSSLTEVQQSCVTNAIGPIPSDAEEEPKYSPNGPSWLWWALAAIPLQDRAKLIILSMTSLDERLRSLRRFLELLVLSR